MQILTHCCKNETKEKYYTNKTQQNIKSEQSLKVVTNLSIFV